MNGFWRDGGLLHYHCGVCGVKRTIPNIHPTGGYPMEEAALYTLRMRVTFTEGKFGIPCDHCWWKVRKRIAQIDPNGHVKAPPVYFT